MLCSLAGASDSFGHLLRGFVLLIRRALIRSGSNAGNPDETNWDEISAPQEVNNMLETTMKIWADNFLAQGMEKGMEKVALKMLAKGKSFEEIAEATDLTIDQIKAVASKDKFCEPAAPYKTARKRKNAT